MNDKIQSAFSALQRSATMFAAAESFKRDFEKANETMPALLLDLRAKKLLELQDAANQYLEAVTTLPLPATGEVG